jgi:hypothetical protein
VWRKQRFPLAARGIRMVSITGTGGKTDMEAADDEDI